MTLFRKKKTITPPIDGITIATPDNYPETNRCWMYISRALIAFLMSFGMILCIKSSFSFPGNSFIIGLVTALTSVCVCFLYYNKWTKNIGYIVLFLVFLWLVSLFRNYANSGFSAMINILYEVMDKKFDLPAVKQYTEQYENRAVTITICLSLFGAVYSIFLNMIFAAKSKPALPFWLTACPIFVGLYFDKLPDYFAFLLYLTGFVSLVMIYDAKTVNNRKAGKQQLHVLASVFLLLGSLLLVILLLVPRASFHTPPSWNRLRQKTDQSVRSFAILGFSSLWDSENIGGTSQGFIGNVGSVSPDFQTDLEVRLAPYTNERIYLRGFIGTYYIKNHWLNTEPNTMRFMDTVFPQSYRNYESSVLKNNQSRANIKNVISAKIQLSIKDSMVSGMYLPYYTHLPMLPNNSLQSYGLSIPTDYYVREETYETYTFEDWDDILHDNLSCSVDDYHANITADTRDDEDWNQDTFLSQIGENLQIPETLEPCTDEFIENAGLSTSNVYDIIQKTMKYYQDNYPYSYNPGKTPIGQDTIAYFLTDNKQGFCSHFASAATMIFRKCGIPARYVEGYAIDYSQILDGDLVQNENYDDWIQGQTTLGKTAVIDVEVNDSTAHAWVEVYVPGLGFVPVDVTPYSSESLTPDNSSFWSVFSNWFTDNALDGAIVDDGQPLIQQSTIQTIRWIFVALAVAFILGILIRVLLYLQKRYRSTHSSSIRNNMAAYHGRLCRKLKKRFPTFAQYNTLQEQATFLVEHNPELVKTLQEYFKILDSVWYQDSITTKQQFSQWYTLYRLVSSKLKKE